MIGRKQFTVHDRLFSSKTFPVPFLAMQAARELKKAMESGNAKVLKDAIDKAKLHTVSPEAWENRCSRVSFTCSYFVSMIE